MYENLEAMAYEEWKALWFGEEELDRTVGQGRPDASACGCCHDDGGYRMRRRTGRTRVIRVCPVCDEEEAEVEDPCIHGPGIMDCGHPDCVGGRFL